MNLLLHPDSDNKLSKHYQCAFKQAIELFIVTAYLTEWDESLELKPACQHFRLIIGKDFGITRKAACKSVMRWLPPERKSQFMVADTISGFHPKAIFWKESTGNCFTIIGSSNLTHAAFNTNFEANVFSNISTDEYTRAKNWVKNIEELAVPVSEDWLKQYQEAIPSNKKNEQNAGIPMIALDLPPIKNMRETKRHIAKRRDQLQEYVKHRTGLIDLFRRCASNQISSSEFWDELPNFWSYDLKDRLMGEGFAILAKHSDFKVLSESYLRILEAEDDDRDDVVVKEIDNLKILSVPTRGSFLSEMLCLEFPEKYPLLDDPVKKYLKWANFKAPRGASQGVRYIDLAKKMRLALRLNPNHPANNLAELDTVLWLTFGN